MPDPESEAQTPRGGFPTTHWTHVQLVQNGSAEEAAKALEAICRRYWYPIYAYLRRRGCTPHDAEDFTQAFFQELIEDDTLQGVRQERGSLRAYLLGVLQRLLVDHARRASAQRRAAEKSAISLEELSAEDRYSREPQETRDPEWVFARAWAEEVFASVRVKLREAFTASGREEVFETLLPFLTCEEPVPSQREIAAKLGGSENAAGILVFRLRKTFRELLEQEIAATVLDPKEIPAEMAWFQKMLRGQ